VFSLLHWRSSAPIAGATWVRGGLADMRTSTADGSDRVPLSARGMSATSGDLGLLV
jgi:hypothetical protein